MKTCGILQKVGAKINECRCTLCNNSYSCIPVLMLIGARPGITIMSILTVSRSTFIYRRVSGGVAPNHSWAVNLSVKDNKKSIFTYKVVIPAFPNF